MGEEKKPKTKALAAIAAEQSKKLDGITASTVAKQAALANTLKTTAILEKNRLAHEDMLKKLALPAQKLGDNYPAVPDRVVSASNDKLTACHASPRENARCTTKV